MLARKNRLAKQKDIELVHRKGKSLANRYFRIKFLITSNKEPRATVIVSQKVYKLATDRNNIKRRIRPHLGMLLTELKKPLDVMLIVQSQVKNLKKRELQEQLEALFSKLRQNIK